MKPVTAVAIGLATACALLAASPAFAAPEAKPGGGGPKPDDCVTQREYDKARVNQPRKAVHKQWGTVGHRVSLSRNGARATEVRTYDVCSSPDSTVTVSFAKGPRGPFRLESKTAVWVA
jgi:hypothetical protein